MSKLLTSKKKIGVGVWEYRGYVITKDELAGANKVWSVTKCPETITEENKKDIQLKLKPNKGQTVLFSKICYSNTVISNNETISLKGFSNFTLVTGIANSNQLVSFLGRL